MWWLMSRRRNVVTLQGFLDESAFRQQLRHLNLEFRPFDDVRAPRRLCSSSLKRAGKRARLAGWVSWGLASLPALSSRGCPLRKSKKQFARSTNKFVNRSNPNHQ